MAVHGRVMPSLVPDTKYADVLGTSAKQPVHGPRDQNSGHSKKARWAGNANPQSVWFRGGDSVLLDDTSAH